MTRKAALFLLAIVLVVLLLPAAVIPLGPSTEPAPPEGGSSDDEAGEKNKGLQIQLYRADMDRVVRMDLEAYLEGVLLAEMPSTFETEALKAQAVAARTYALQQMRSLGGEGCSETPVPADICTQSGHCQAWLDPEKTVAQWGPEGEVLLERIRAAIAETSGEALLYRGKLIEAVYHSTCGGKTEASHALWSGGELPYLQSVNCPYCKHSPHYRGEHLIPIARLVEVLPQELALPVASGEQLQLELVSSTPGERVGTLKINGMPVEGPELRRLLELPSTAFVWEIKEEGLLLHTRGKGHGAGLCQYGADGAAKAGKNYRQILMFYYPGVEIAKFIP